MKINLGQISLGFITGVIVTFFLTYSDSIFEGFKKTEKKHPKPSYYNTVPREGCQGVAEFDENEKSLATATIFFASLPPVACVGMDGKYVGQTNVSEIRVIPGKRKMKFWKGKYSKEMVMEFDEGKNPPQILLRA